MLHTVFTLLLWKSLFLDKRKLCDRYEGTTTVETSADERPAKHIKAKNYKDFITGKECHYSNVSILPAEGLRGDYLVKVC